MSTQTKQLQNALKHLQTAMKSLAAAKKRKTKRKNPCKAKANPRVLFLKTHRGRKPVKRAYSIIRKGKPTFRFKATKVQAYTMARKMARKTRKLVLDGPK